MAKDSGNFKSDDRLRTIVSIQFGFSHGGLVGISWCFLVPFTKILPLTATADKL